MVACIEDDNTMTKKQKKSSTFDCKIECTSAGKILATPMLCFVTIHAFWQTDGQTRRKSTARPFFACNAVARIGPTQDSCVVLLSLIFFKNVTISYRLDRKILHSRSLYMLIASAFSASRLKTAGELKIALAGTSRRAMRERCTIEHDRFQHWQT